MRPVCTLMLVLFVLCITSPSIYAFSGITTIAFTAEDFHQARKTHSYRIVNEDYYGNYGGPDALITEKPYSFAQMAYTDQLTVFWENNWDDPEDTFDFDARRYPVRDYLNGQEFSVRDDPHYWFNLDDGNGAYGPITNEVYNDIIDKNRMAMLQDSCPLAQSTNELAFMKIEKTVLLTGQHDHDTNKLLEYSELIRSNPFPNQVNHTLDDRSRPSGGFLTNLLVALGIKSNSRWNPYAKCGAPLIYVEFRDPETGDLVRHWLLDFRLDIDPRTGKHVWEWLPELEKLQELARTALGDQFLYEGDVVPFRIVTLQPYVVESVNLPDRRASVLRLPQLTRFEYQYGMNNNLNCSPQLVVQVMAHGGDIPAECGFNLMLSLPELHALRAQAVCEAFPDSPLCKPPEPVCTGKGDSDTCGTNVTLSPIEPPRCDPSTGGNCEVKYPLPPGAILPGPPDQSGKPEPESKPDISQPSSCLNVNDSECGYVKEQPQFYTYISG